MTGYCTCPVDFPGRYPVLPGATWHYLCERPIKPQGARDAS